ncbi:DUF2780 domain-containing protein [Pseudomonas sp. UL073]|uniref:DUF2780 domain-containing protein n=1 Tax=Zestomonas insulae TaxID=2809017 RepID=A0ABS2IK06_9GAMM|nr:DUF2780 domain-containing protein [Pseudomonas insulae]MBM7062285.1 DUF2780 domain-containing protein [Pseudomonas insulae]
MLRRAACLLTASLFFSAAPAFAINLQEVAGLLAANPESQALLPADSGLIQALTSQLQVTPQQAAGGSAALLGVAEQQLASGDYAQLLGVLLGGHQPTGGEGLGGLGGLVGALGDESAEEAPDASNVQGELGNRFTTLGMDSQLVAPFAQVLLGYFGQQGLGGGVLDNLSQVWGVGAAPSVAGR